MAELGIDIDSLRNRLRSDDSIRDQAFELLRDIACVVNNDDLDGQELVLRAMDRRSAFEPYTQILDGLTRRLGLFPYLDGERLDLADRLTYEAFRADSLDDGTVFHRPQAQVYWKLMEGENVVLSAPTSFGKSLIIDAVVASGKHAEVLVIVPTIALIDETRRRLSRKFGASYRILTHGSQVRGERNVYVFTQERFLDAAIEQIDFFVIDEFYKLGDADERCMLLNQVLYKLLKTKAQFYMLGPNIQGLAESSSASLNYVGYIEKYRTVVADVEDHRGAGDEFARLVALCQTLHEPTIIFCSSPSRCAKVAEVLVSAGINSGSDVTGVAADWISNNYHPDWHVVNALRSGIGIHHARIPRALGQFVVRAFNQGDCAFLVCTSTLIEGVNTSAKNIIIFDSKINKQPIDYFTFNNIQGRSGRMGKHFIGKVFLFHDPPEPSLPLVEMPLFAQTANTPTSLLIQLDDSDLTPGSKERLATYTEQDFISYEVLRKNNGIDPERQVALAREISSQPRKYSRLLGWSRSPTWEQLLAVCGLMWIFFDGGSLARQSVRTPAQLAFLINDLRRRPTTKEMVEASIGYWKSADTAISVMLDFLKLWANFHFPRLLRAIDNVQREVLARYDLPTGNFESYAAAAENLFLPPTYLALEEYGIPIEIVRKLDDFLDSEADLDAALERLRSVDPEKLGLQPFELIVLQAFQESI